MTKPLLVLAVVILSSCGSVPKPIEISYPATDPRRIAFVKSLTVDDKVIGPISAVGCRSSWFRNPDEVPGRIALQEIRAAAARMGATGVYRLSYTPAPIVNGCGMKDGVRASGIAFRRAENL